MQHKRYQHTPGESAGMSIDAISWAFKQNVKPSSLKFVLVALADNCTHDGLAWPSLKALAEKTGQDRKTIIASLDKLESMGIIADSGKRVGATGQVKVYCFKSTENGTVPKTEQYRFSRETVPFFPGNSTENGTRNLKGTIKESSKPISHKKPTPVPANFEVTEAMFDWAVAEGLNPNRIRTETEQFLDRNKASGKSYLDWPAAWRTWIRNSVKFARAA
jgi:hypothetical protein